MGTLEFTGRADLLAVADDAQLCRDACAAHAGESATHRAREG